MKQPELGRKIAELRKTHGLTQEDLVEKCNISVRTIQRIESGEVTPRSYTIKTILSALDSELDEVREEVEAKHESNTHESHQANWSRYLTIAWIMGLVYFILGFFESVADAGRLAGDLGMSNSAYIITKVLVLVSFTVFIAGFIIVGRQYDNYLLRVASIVFIALNAFLLVYDVVSLFYDPIGYEYFIVGASITLGGIGLIFTLALFRLNQPLGPIALAAGACQLLVAVCFLTVVLSPIGLILTAPAEILTIILLFKAQSKLNVKQAQPALV
ncbi:MAG: helix-turn-helix transcriptional regulator [Cyclobacteriaceae bacterium]